MGAVELEAEEDEAELAGATELFSSAVRLLRLVTAVSIAALSLGWMLAAADTAACKAAISPAMASARLVTALVRSASAWVCASAM